MQAEFLRYTIIAANVPNPGRADIEFMTVPEPASLAVPVSGLFFLLRFDTGPDWLLILAGECRYKVSTKLKRMAKSVLLSSNATKLHVR